MNKELEVISDTLSELASENSKLLQRLQDIKQEESKLLARSYKLQDLKFYAYIVFVDGVERYIGKGNGDRWKHSIGGGSHVPELNRDFFAGKHIEVRLWLGVGKSSEVEALRDETNLMFSVLYDGGLLYNKTTPINGEYLNCCFKQYSSFLGSVDGTERIKVNCSLLDYE